MDSEERNCDSGAKLENSTSQDIGSTEQEPPCTPSQPSTSQDDESTEEMLSSTSQGTFIEHESTGYSSTTSQGSTEDVTSSFTESISQDESTEGLSSSLNVQPVPIKVKFNFEVSFSKRLQGAKESLKRPAKSNLAAESSQAPPKVPKMKIGAKGTRQESMEPKSEESVSKRPEAAATNSPPKVFAPKKEKIVLCVDFSPEPPLEARRRGDMTLNILLALVKEYIRKKHRLNREQEFALYLIVDTYYYLRGFTKGVDDLFRSIDRERFVVQRRGCDLRGLLSTLHNFSDIPSAVPDDPTEGPEFVVRNIIIYTRSCTVPLIHENEAEFFALRESPYLITDILFIRNRQREGCCVFNALKECCDSRSLVYECERNIESVRENLEWFLPNVLSRPIRSRSD